eukprot:TRINITY_DN13442_c0_g1_i1.p1 TRINITY_DN13442_c0_g1~~TRINITY_DN13442_c0_g1_i1.p1  ORF type:complete len:220 (-),score=20.42 TRINITY_DN13442_c0_g1_i1:21-602(-)
MKGYLTSNKLCRDLLDDGARKILTQNCIIRGWVLRGQKFPDRQLVPTLHPICLRRLPEDIFCRLCGRKYISSIDGDLVLGYDMEWLITDGTKTYKMEALESVCEEILRISPKHFDNLPAAEKARRLLWLVENEFYFSVSTVQARQNKTSRKRKRHEAAPSTRDTEILRVDAIAQVNLTVEVERLISKLKFDEV